MTDSEKLVEVEKDQVAQEGQEGRESKEAGFDDGEKIRVLKERFLSMTDIIIGSLRPLLNMSVHEGIRYAWGEGVGREINKVKLAQGEFLHFIGQLETAQVDLKGVVTATQFHIITERLVDRIGETIPNISFLRDNLLEATKLIEDYDEKMRARAQLKKVEEEGAIERMASAYYDSPDAVRHPNQQVQMTIRDEAEKIFSKRVALVEARITNLVAQVKEMSKN
ncbi:hypothetical protein KJ707_03245 [Patescibacteria group bacterium]|nr:hypothetical protein [Patescibacteria group bacterium]MBU1967456.1 hypothetical protein [Patescibacteria group bacterium]MBU2543553.1 hypothetical protein [Patescibacteria group bacterium]